MNPDDTNQPQPTKLESELPPSTVYTYLKADYALADILSMSMRTCDATSTNDPFEYDWDVVFDKRMSSTPDLTLERNRIIETTKKDAAAKMKFISFADLPNNPLLWSYYGDRHKGVCIGVSASIQIGPDNGMEPVEYDNPVKIPVGTDVRPDEEDKERLKHFFRAKRVEWKHENEWRLLIPSNNPRMIANKDGTWDFRLNPCDIETIVFGCRCSQIDMGRIGLACLQRKLQVKYETADCDLDTFTITTDLVSPETMDYCMRRVLYRN